MGCHGLIHGGLDISCHGNISEDPRFADGATGQWSTDPVYDADTGATTLTDSTASWERNVLAKTMLNPDASQMLQFLVIGNTETTLTVWGDARDLAQSGDTYRIHDYHLQEGSPCIDAGDPALDWSNEPDYPAGRIDMGCYGNWPAPPAPPPLPPGAFLFTR